MKSLIAVTGMAVSMLEPANAAEPQLQITRAGTREVNVAPAQNFTGSVKVEMLYAPVGAERASAGTVSFAPGARTAWHSQFAQLTDEVLFGDIWARPGLSQRDRSLITVSALIAMNRPEQLRGHMARARQNGVSDAELIEAITHLAFYAGWPSAVTAVGVARGLRRQRILGERVTRSLRIATQAMS